LTLPGEVPKSILLGLDAARLKNLITGVPGLRVGHAHDERLGSGVTALIFEAPAIASITAARRGCATRLCSNLG
jgi:D-aminopeptidase